MAGEPFEIRDIFVAIRGADIHDGSDHILLKAEVFAE
jgi:hypothetical protein